MRRVRLIRRSASPGPGSLHRRLHTSGETQQQQETQHPELLYTPDSASSTIDPRETLCYDPISCCSRPTVLSRSESRRCYVATRLDVVVVEVTAVEVEVETEEDGCGSDETDCPKQTFCRAVSFGADSRLNKSSVGRASSRRAALARAVVDALTVAQVSGVVRPRARHLAKSKLDRSSSASALSSSPSSRLVVMIPDDRIPEALSALVGGDLPADLSPGSPWALCPITLLDIVRRIRQLQLSSVDVRFWLVETKANSATDKLALAASASGIESEIPCRLTSPVP
ncbi:hypothetical protein PYCC9005_002957 [Savitreella phatthalungensis]